jgi:hypothetical protein
MGLLDLLWQKNLSTQLDETRYLFAGKTQHEKHLADREQALYRYARHLKDHVLPSPGVKIFLLHDSALRGYRRLKAQHYLLPHNVFNFGKLPRENSLQKGDYLLVLDKVGELVYAAESGQLQWHDRLLSPSGVRHCAITLKGLSTQISWKLWDRPRSTGGDPGIDSIYRDNKCYCGRQ